MKQFLKCCTGLILVIIIVLSNSAQDANGQQYYNAGDVNYDGWCNMADVNILAGYLVGNCSGSGFCWDGADCNGSGTVNGLDATCLVSFLGGGGFSPVGVCPAVTKTCDPLEQAEIWLVPVANLNPNRATFSVYVEASADIGALNFSYKYDPLEIASFSTSNHSNVISVIGSDRVFTGGENIRSFIVLCANSGNGVNYPMNTGGTRIFDIIVDRQPGVPNSLLRIVEDPIHGPPYFYFGSGGNCAGEEIICPFVPVCVPGDVNGSGSYNGLDITYGVAYLKGGPGPIAKYFYNVPISW